MIVREPDIRPEPRRFVEALGRKGCTLISEIGRASMICIEGTLDFRYLFRVRARREVIRQLHICAVKSLPVVTVVAFFIGMILALQIGIEIHGKIVRHVVDVKLSVNFSVEREARHACNAGAHSDELSDGGGKFYTYTCGGHVGVDCEMVEQILRCGCSRHQQCQCRQNCKDCLFHRYVCF